MKSRMRQILHLISGGIKSKDITVLTFTALFFIMGAVTLFKILFISKHYYAIYNPVISFSVCFLILKYDKKIFPFVFWLLSICICLFSHETYYNSLAIFIVMILITSNNRRSRNFLLASLIVFGVSVASFNDDNIINIFAILIQFAFASFCYYGFIYIRVADISHCSKLIYTDEERVVLHALATQDKSQKEVAYELGMQIHEVTYILNRVKRKNRINTTDMLLRLYAIEISKAEN